MKHIYMIITLIACTVAGVSAMKPTEVDPFGGIKKLYSEEKLTYEQAKEFFEAKTFNEADAQAFCDAYQQQCITYAKRIGEDAWSMLNQIETAAAGLWLLRECQKFLCDNHGGRSVKHIDDGHKAHEAGENLCKSARFSSMIQHAKKTLHEDQIKDGLEALKLYVLFMKSEFGIPATDPIMETYYTENKDAIERYQQALLKSNKGNQSNVIAHYRAGTLTLSAAKQLWKQDKNSFIANKDATDKFCDEFCDSHKEFIIIRTQNLADNPSWQELENAFAALFYLSGCETLLSGAVLRSEEKSDAQVTATKIIENHNASLIIEIVPAKTEHATKAELHTGIAACQIYQFFGTDAEKIMFSNTGEELEQRLATLSKPQKDDQKVHKGRECVQRTWRSPVSSSTIKKILIGGFTLAALAAASWFAINQYDKKNKAGLKSQPNV